MNHPGIVGVVVAAVVIIIGRVGRLTLVAVAGYILLAIAAAIELYIRLR